MEALWGTVRLESCFPPFLRRGGVLVKRRVVEGGLGPWRRRGGRMGGFGKGGRWRGWECERVVVRLVGSFARIVVGGGSWLRFPQAFRFGC